MASVTDAASAASLPPSAEIERAEAFARERFVLEGEDAESALAAGTARREALDAALSELADGATEPSIHWRQNYSLLLGLERLLLEPEPVLDDGTSLNAHQVDALSGTLAALSTELQAATARSRNGARIAPTAPDVDEEAEAAAAVAAARREADRTTVVREAAVELEPASEPEPDDALDEELAPLEDDDLDLEDDEDLEEFETAPPDLDDEADAEPDDELEAVAEIGTEEADDDVEPETLAEDEEPLDWDPSADEDDEIVDDAPDDPGASRRFWFEHATGAGKSVAAVGFVAASQTGGVLILTHRRNLVDQFIGEISSRGYGKRLSPPLLRGQDRADGPVTVETYQWFVRNAGKISDAYSIVICDEAHTALGEKTSHSIRAWTGPVFIGMTATGALIARHVADLFPTQTSRFDLAQAARRGVISPLRCVRIPPGPGVRTIAKVPLRKGEVDQDFDQEELAALLDQAPFNLAIADLYKSRFRAVPGVVYTAGVQHAKNVAAAMQAAGIRARAVSGETPKRELAAILAAFERGEVDVLCNAQLLAEGWNSPRATLCMHLAPTASRRIYQQRVGRVTRRNPGKEAGLVVDLVHPATTHDETIVTLHSLLDRDVYRGGAIVVGPVRRGRGRKVRVERRVLPVSNNPEKRVAVLEREIWRVAVENLDWAEQHVWAALAGARVTTNQWRRAKAMIQHDSTKDLMRRFLLTALQRNRNHQLRLKALTEIAGLRDPEAFDDAIDMVGTWPRDDRRAGTKVLLQALSERQIGRRDQAQAWIWRLAGYTKDVHEEYSVQRWPETKRLLGLLVNSSGRAHGRNARRIVQAARKQDRRLAASLLAAASAHTPEGEEVLRGARMRTARKPSAVARELLRNFPKSGSAKKRRRRRKKGRKGVGDATNANAGGNGQQPQGQKGNAKAKQSSNGGGNQASNAGGNKQRSRRRRSRRGKGSGSGGDDGGTAGSPDREAV